MKKIFSILAIAALMAGCSKEDSTTDVAPATFTLTGYTSNDTRTAFGEPYEANTEDWRIPFIWSEGDKIWSGSEQSTEATINDDGSASFSFTNEPQSTIYYNMTGSSATEANVPAEQSIEKNLGQNGDFGYATVEDGTFTLSHATAYLWFNTTTNIDNATLKTITINADGVNIAGKATWSGSSFGAVSEGKSEVTLTVNQLLSSTNGNVWAMVVLPANLTGKKIKVIYELSIGGNTKYHIQTLNGKNIEAGKTQKISTEITNENVQAYRELRVLTFEDIDVKFEPHDIEISYFDYSIYETITETKNITKWSDYIPNSQSGNGHNTYSWYDKGNTELEFTQQPPEESFYGIAGHAGISKYVGTNYQEEGNHMYDLQAYNVEGGANGSDNFCTQYGYVDPPKIEFSNSPQGLPNLHFHDGIARVIDHMYVTNTTYAYNILISGESGFGGSYEFTDDSQFWVVAYGYETDEDEDPTVVKFCLLDKGKQIVTDWTKWDLTGLGKVVKVEFNLEAGDNGYGEYGLVIPGYFAYDDIAVQF